MISLVMIPALGCDAGLYAPLVPLLGDLVSLRTVIADGDRLDGCVAQVLAAAPESFVVLGTSFGGRVGLETALAAPARVKGVVVIGASAAASPDREAGLRRSERLRGQDFEAVVAEMATMIAYAGGPQGPAARDAFVAMARRQGGHLMARQSDALAWRDDLTPRLGAIACPALMLWGADDRFVAARDGLKMSTLVPHGRYAEIPACGHVPSLEAPEETADIIRNWLDDANLV